MKDEKFRTEGLKSLSFKYLNQMREAYDIMIQSESALDFMSRIMCSDLLENNYHLVYSFYSVGSSSTQATIFGKSFEDIFLMRGEIALLIMEQICKQEQMIEDGKFLEASLNVFSFISILSKTIIRSSLV